MKKKELIILFVIVVAQFMCTSLWFAGNAALPQLGLKLQLTNSDLAWMTSSVQLGFIVGTLTYAFWMIADRFNASSVFLISAVLGALCNFLITFQVDYFQILVFRFFTGFFLAGIYPVGMKIASDHFEKGLGRAMSFLVGALVLGTALPHLITAVGASWKWENVLYLTSCLTVFGGLSIKFFVGEGMYKKKGAQPKFAAIKAVFKDKAFSSAAFGYFGHMWELYAFWAFVPTMLISSGHFHLDDQQAISFQSFVVIGLGAVACFVGGFLADRIGIKKMAFIFLFSSGICCLLSPLAFELDRELFFGFMIFWGLMVIGDSPLFSTLVAQNAVPEIKGTALTMVTCIGFALTIVTIQLLGFLIPIVDDKFVFLALLPGPVFGLLFLKR